MKRKEADYQSEVRKQHVSEKCPLAELQPLLQDRNQR